MMAPGFKPVGWVAGVAASAIGCYMLSLNVASERAELLRIERQIIAAKQDIRSLQTELGTRGRLAQLEQWNADVLALSAPATTQFLEDEVKLARFDRIEPGMDEHAEVRMASADVAPEPAKPIAAPVVRASVPEVSAPERSPLLHQASLTIPAPKARPAAALTVETVRPAKAASSAPSPSKPVKAAIALPAAAKPVKPANVDSGAAKPTRFASADTRAVVSAKQANPASRIGADLVQQIDAAAKLEASRGRR